ncbi:serine--tRNA ligase [Candidatus Beckwithbacteria bacterium RBG_13_42_9]|uniref:Serine--tRNA ligase n=1 Tax=Candidatus Beckwithbacteria bacterium RBG_13_42_9 TaxID=1797457 RepID=A0A1F5E8S0_9BACT|nr:MAG: serine--tRNA ligase [Candidatus Beckwithbacteria bacterium RBG_13_42_9]
MLDIQLIRQNPEKIKRATKDKRVNSKVVDELLMVDEKRRKLISEVEKIKQERNNLLHGVKGKPDALIIEKGKKFKEELVQLEPQLEEVEKEFLRLMCQIPNPAADDVKFGKNESENEVLRKWGEPKEFHFKIKDHLEIGEGLGMIDVNRAAKVSGSRFGYFKDDAVRLEFALVQFALETLGKEGFMPVIPPVLIKQEMMQGMGYMEHGGDEDMYLLDKDKLVLVGTSEQAIGPMHANEVINTKNLPLRYMGFSTCFRREAGSYGKDTKGIFRVHQFDKVEMFSLVKAEDSDQEHDFLLSLEEKLFQALEIPYQVIKMCTGDLGFPAARKYDIEAWLPAQGKYREVTSTSTTTDFQSRRLNIKYNDGTKNSFVYLLNGTAFAIGRTIIAILENYQQENGSVKIPKVLQKYIGKEKIC